MTDEQFMRQLKMERNEAQQSLAETRKDLDSARADAATLREHAEALAAALDDLLVWAEWIRKHVHRAPRMDEPNTGARLAAHAALAAWREGPGKESEK